VLIDGPGRASRSWDRWSRPRLRVEFRDTDADVGGPYAGPSRASRSATSSSSDGEEYLPRARAGRRAASALGESSTLSCAGSRGPCPRQRRGSTMGFSTCSRAARGLPGRRLRHGRPAGGAGPASCRGAWHPARAACVRCLTSALGSTSASPRSRWETDDLEPEELADEIAAHIAGGHHRQATGWRSAVNRDRIDVTLGRRPRLTRWSSASALKRAARTGAQGRPDRCFGHPRREPRRDRQARVRGR